ncbi:MAG: crossover junction endodeoxyribonuclease RuvC [Candidatus Parcubacteria bacterium]|nr:MAG: crossover junction endodeoxyribonuclease RuvC [Candidatus Parcubacteria bacterium]
MKIIGIDPGSTRAGFGIIKFQKNNPLFLKGGIIKVTASEKNRRLVELEREFQKLIKHQKIEAAGIEKLYFVKNLKTGLEVAQARGVLLLCLSKKRVPIYEWTPTEIKQIITGNGSADKQSIEKMVKIILRIKEFRQPDDVFDALAIALVTGYHLSSRLK